MRGLCGGLYKTKRDIFSSQLSKTYFSEFLPPSTSYISQNDLCFEETPGAEGELDVFLPDAINRHDNCWLGTQNLRLLLNS